MLLCTKVPQPFISNSREQDRERERDIIFCTATTSYCTIFRRASNHENECSISRIRTEHFWIKRRKKSKRKPKESESVKKNCEVWKMHSCLRFAHTQWETEYLPNAPIEIRWQDITSVSQMNGASVEGNQGIRHELHIPLFRTHDDIIPWTFHLCFLFRSFYSGA